MHWPNVFNLQSVLLEHVLPIHYMCFVGEDTIATLSEPHPSSKKQDLVLSSTLEARVLHRSQVQGIKSLAQTRRNTIILLSEDGSTSEMLVEGEATAQAVDLSSPEGYSSAYVS